MNGHFKLDRLLSICLGLGVVALLFIRPGTLGTVAPYAVFLLCPLMHVFMMGHMGDGHEHRDNEGAESTGACHSSGAAPSGAAEKESV